MTTMDDAYYKAGQWKHYVTVLKNRELAAQMRHDEIVEAPLNINHVESGRYFLDSRKGETPPYRRPVAIWRDAQRGFIMLVNGKPTNDRGEPYTEEYALKLWGYFAQNVITKERYTQAVETGQWWDGLKTEPTVQTGDNKSTDPFQRLKEELDDKLASTESWLAAHGKCKDQAEADYAANLNRELLAYRKQADALFEAEKAPVLQQAREIDAKYAFRKTVTQFADRLKELFGAYAIAEKRRLDAEREKAIREENAKRIAREEMQRRALENAPLNEMPPALDLPEPTPPPPPVKVQVGGGVGSARGIKSVWRWRWIGANAEAEMASRNALLLHYADHPDVTAVIEKIVNAQVRLNKGSTKLPGVEVYEDLAVA